MIYDPLPIELAMWARYVKFQPAAEPDGFCVGNCTRTYLEYDGVTGDYVDRDPVTGEIVDAGQLWGEDRQEAA